LTTENLGILHPGEMGITVAGAAQNTAHIVHWASEGRSPQTRERAVKIDQEFRFMELR